MDGGFDAPGPLAIAAEAGVVPNVASSQVLLAAHVDWRPDEETVNQAIHALGFVLSVAGSVVLLRGAWTSGGAERLLGCSVYAASLMALYLASTLSHSFGPGPRRTFYRMLDQVCIFGLIAGSYTPFGLVHSRNWMDALVLLTLWGAALAGMAARILRPSHGLPIAWFIPLGWLPVLVLGRMYEVGGAPGLALVMLGGAAYTGGTWFLANDDRGRYYHGVWHVATLIGSGCHYAFLLSFVALHGA